MNTYGHTSFSLVISRSKVRLLVPAPYKTKARSNAGLCCFCRGQQQNEKAFPSKPPVRPSCAAIHHRCRSQSGTVSVRTRSLRTSAPSAKLQSCASIPSTPGGQRSGIIPPIAQPSPDDRGMTSRDGTWPRAVTSPSSRNTTRCSSSSPAQPSRSSPAIPTPP